MFRRNDVYYSSSSLLFVTPRPTHRILSMKCSSGCSCSPITRCDEFWFEDGNLVLQAQHTQYKVHRSLMSNRSDFFRDMLTLPDATEGTEAAPLFLPDVGEKHFTILMKFLYSQWGDDLKFTTYDWLSVVRVAHRFQFTSALRVGMDNCADLEPDLKLYWAEQLGITEWELPARHAAVLAFDLYGESAPDSPAYMALWLKIYRARETLARVRAAYMQRCIVARDAAPVPFKPLCQHMAAALTLVIPRASRKDLKTKVENALREGPMCKGGCLTFGEESMLLWLPREEDEFDIINQSWCSLDHCEQELETKAYWLGLRVIHNAHDLAILVE
ncbi:hypothetical protein EXIGLDRAFT_790330 [Exidia glandulosa HHB12029]|uniref:BTB domain-containing protein n=1 Tax=Exidia glandulosa HHB12029 TaxID=1314781 RepID=A0A165HTU5_EXIGL|nr:hypothetical protein EXIGLDRAFT_790330 [Exidia glandulosa HHB12029]